jgi:MSHA biogenesis protein MshO
MMANQQRGFTLVEMIMVMVITGIIGGMVAMFIRAPVQGYVDSARRAEMTDIADTAVRRLARDIRTAVPNSVRVPVTPCNAPPANPCYVEFLPTRDGGRYRANTPGNVLKFGIVVANFDIIGSPITFVAGDQVVVGSTQSDGNPPYQDPTAVACNVAATTTCIRRPIAAAGALTTVTFTPSAAVLPLWAELPSQRFDVVDGTQQAVTYACTGTLGTLATNGDGQASLVRYWNYGFHGVQQTPAGIAANTAPVAAHIQAILADKVSACEITYNAISQRNGLLEINLSITRGNETVRLYQAIHVNNAP